MIDQRRAWLVGICTSILYSIKLAGAAWASSVVERLEALGKAYGLRCLLGGDVGANQAAGAAVSEKRASDKRCEFCK